MTTREIQWGSAWNNTDETYKFNAEQKQEWMYEV